jgi:hypothetical protein
MWRTLFVALALAVGMIPPGAHAGSHGGNLVSILESTNYNTSNSNTLYLAPFGNAGLTSGVDYTDNATALASTFPNNTVIQWRWPTTVAPGGVYGHNSIDWGLYQGNPVPVPITPQQLKSITTLQQTHNYSWTGFSSGFDAFDDMWLTSASGNDSTITFEVEIFLHSPTYIVNYVNGATQLGTITISGITWQVAWYGGQSIPDILFMPSNAADVLAATLDIRAMFQYVISQGVLTGNEWFNGLSLGMEPRQEGGSMIINAFSMVYN